MGSHKEGSGNSASKWILLGAIVGVVIAFFYFDLGQFLTLSHLKDQKDSLVGIIESNRIFAYLIFMAIYITVTALSFPGAVVMTLAAGALFGVVWGTFMVSFASTIGATIAFLTARFLLRDWVQNQFSEKLASINKGIEEDGPFYLFTLRLVPLFPFFVINLVMGLTPLRTVTYFFVSQLGMLPGTIVYVNAGTQLGELDSLQGILSLNLIFSFVLLGLFPIIAKKLIEYLKQKRTA